MTSFGLPRYVVTFLRYMEDYKECLKWNIHEGTHKVTLTLQWNFRKLHSAHGTLPGHENLWTRLQKTLNIGGRAQETSLIPPDLSDLLERSPKKQNSKSQRNSAFRRQLSWARLSTFSLPARLRHLHSSNTNSPDPSFRESASCTFRGGSPNRVPVTACPSHYSWPEPSLSSSLPLIDMPSCSADPLQSTPITSTPDSTRSDISPLSPGGHLRISYKMEDELGKSSEEILEETHQKAKDELESIKKEWNAAIKNWPKTLVEEGATGGAQSSDSEPEANLQKVTQTVQKCITSCDKILERHSTLIE